MTSRLEQYNLVEWVTTQKILLTKCQSGHRGEVDNRSKMYPKRDQEIIWSTHQIRISREDGEVGVTFLESHTGSLFSSWKRVYFVGEEDIELDLASLVEDNKINNDVCVVVGSKELKGLLLSGILVRIIQSGPEFCIILKSVCGKPQVLERISTAQPNLNLTQTSKQ